MSFIFIKILINTLFLIIHLPHRGYTEASLLYGSANVNGYNLKPHSLETVVLEPVNINCLPYVRIFSPPTSSLHFIQDMASDSTIYCDEASMKEFIWNNTREDTDLDDFDNYTSVLVLREFDSNFLSKLKKVY